MGIITSGSLQLSLELGICGGNHRNNKRFRNSKARGELCVRRSNLSSSSLYSWNTDLSKRIRRRVCTIPSREHQCKCRCFLNTGPSLDATCIKNATLTLTRSFNSLIGNPLVIKLASAVGIVVFAIWGLGPLVQQSRHIFLRKSDNSWKRSSTYQVTTSYVQPLLLWAGAIFICRALDPVNLPSESGQIVKQRLLNFVKSLSTVLVVACCVSSVIQQAQKFFMETSGPTDSSSMGFQFAGRAVHTAVWVAAVSLFMELIGFSTQKWITAGGLGTVLITLAGREILTNFLSSVMIHSTRPFVLNEWIQTKIQGYDVSGTIEHVGWWSPTIVRGDDREAVHIPNNKFTVNVVRNLSQKTHWRIKTHLAISHLDVGKVNNIVADMRKVVAKNPQVEQQKLHRRVFLDNIDPENQGLLILVSCFVKTSRFEEYLCVKEAILLDLLRVISHHRARLATPIRTLQKIYRDPADSVPFSDSIYNWATNADRPYVLIEPPYKINGEDKTKTQARSAHANGEEDSKAAPASTDSGTKEMQDAKNRGGANNKHDEGSSSAAEVKQGPINRHSLEENIVLGVALDGSKRTLPIDEDDTEDTKEMAPLRSGNATEKEKSDGKRPNSPAGDH